MRYILGLTFEERGLKNIPTKPVIFAVKHQSTWETMYFLWRNKDNSYIMKQELDRIPLWRSYMSKCGHVMVNRSGGLSAIKRMISNTKDVLDDNRSVVIFPEGTRTLPSHTSPYHPGIAALYLKTDATIVPVALNSGIFWGRRKFIKNRGRLTIEFLPPMPSGLTKNIFMEEIEKRIESATRRLESEARENISIVD